MIVQHDAIAGAKLTRGTPLCLARPARQLRIPAHTVIRREPYRVTLCRLDAHDGPACRHEEAFGTARMVLAVDPSHELPTDQLANLTWTFARLYPRVGRDARVSSADVLAPPVVVHFINAVDENEARLGEVVRGRHDHVPHAPRRQCLVDLAGDQAVLVNDVALVYGPLAPQELLCIREIGLVRLVLLLRDREGQPPLAILAHRLHELVRDQEREIELPQPTVLALGADELHDIRMTDVEGAHLRAAAPAGGGDGETHLVEDIHEGQRTGRVGTRSRHAGRYRPSFYRWARRPWRSDDTFYPRYRATPPGSRWRPVPKDRSWRRCSCNPRRSECSDASSHGFQEMPITALQKAAFSKAALFEPRA